MRKNNYYSSTERKVHVAFKNVTWKMTVKDNDKHAEIRSRVIDNAHKYVDGFSKELKFSFELCYVYTLDSDVSHMHELKGGYLGAHEQPRGKYAYPWSI